MCQRVTRCFCTIFINGLLCTIPLEGNGVLLRFVGVNFIFRLISIFGHVFMPHRFFVPLVPQLTTRFFLYNTGRQVYFAPQILLTRFFDLHECFIFLILVHSFWGLPTTFYNGFMIHHMEQTMVCTSYGIIFQRGTIVFRHIQIGRGQ